MHTDAVSSFRAPPAPPRRARARASPLGARRGLALDCLGASGDPAAVADALRLDELG